MTEAALNTHLFADPQEGETIAFRWDRERCRSYVRRDRNPQWEFFLPESSLHNGYARVSDWSIIESLLNYALALGGWKLVFLEARNADGSVNQPVTDLGMGKTPGQCSFDEYERVEEIRYAMRRAEEGA